MNKKYLSSALILYLNYFIHGIGCSILSQQVVKEMLANQWGLKDVMAVTSIAAALGLGRLISLPFAGPLSDKLGRRFSVIIGCASYVVFLVGIAFSPNTILRRCGRNKHIILNASSCSRSLYCSSWSVMYFCTTSSSL